MYSVQSSKSFLVGHRHVEIIGSSKERNKNSDNISDRTYKQGQIWLIRRQDFHSFVNLWYGTHLRPGGTATTTAWGAGLVLGSRVGVVVRALAFHQCVPGSIPGPGVICGLSLLVLYSAPRGFSPGTPVFPSPQKPTFDLIWFIWFTVSPISTALVLG